MNGYDVPMNGYDSPISFPGISAPSVPALAAVKVQRPQWYKYMPCADWNKWWDELPAGWSLLLSIAGTAAYFVVPAGILMACVAKMGDNGAWLGFPLAIGFEIFILAKTT